MAGTPVKVPQEKTYLASWKTNNNSHVYDVFASNESVVKWIILNCYLS